MPCLPSALSSPDRQRGTHSGGHEPLNTRQKLVKRFVDYFRHQMPSVIERFIHLSLIVGLGIVDGIELVVQVFNVFVDLEAVRLDGLDDDLGIVLDSHDRRVLYKQKVSVRARAQSRHMR